MLRAPRNRNETFKLIARIRDRGSIEAALDLYSWSEVTPIQVYGAVLARVPETGTLARPTLDYDSRSHFLAALTSEEFQTHAVDAVIDELKSLRRVIFVHIPKCGGTYTVGLLAETLPYMNRSHSERGWTGVDDFFRHLSRTMIESITATELLIAGHFSLDFALSAYYRFDDVLFTILRDPKDIALSMTNYALGVLYEDRDLSRPDTREWWSYLNRAPIYTEPGSSSWTALSEDIIRCSQIVQPNSMCSYLGDGTFEGALDLLSRAPVMLVDIRDSDKWIRSRWGISASAPMNQSTPYLTWATLSPDDRQHIDAINSEDLDLYNLFVDTRQAKQEGTMAIFGAELRERLSDPL